MADAVAAGHLSLDHEASWFDAILAAARRLPGPRSVTVLIAGLLIAVPLHLADLVDDPGAAVGIRGDLLIGALSLPLFIWLALALDDVAGRSLARLRPALDPSGLSEAEILAGLSRTPGKLALPAAGLGVIGGISSVLQSPQNWRVDLDYPGAALAVAVVLSVVTEVLLLGLLAHVLHQLWVVNRVHRQVRIDLFHLEPLYAFSTFTAWTGIGLLALTVVLAASLSLAVGTFLLEDSSDLIVAGIIVAVGIACFFVPLLGLHDRIADEKAARLADANATLAAVVAEVRGRVERGDMEGAARIKDALLAADASVAAIARTSTWPWRSETLRGFVSAVLLPIGLFLIYELTRRALDG